MKHLKNSLFLLLFIFLMAALAVSASAVRYGDCGENAKWNLSDAGILTISPKTEGTTGEVTQPEYYINYVSEIKGIVVEDGITSICDRAFYGLSSAKAVVLKDSVQSVGKEAFRGCSSLQAISAKSNLTSIGEGAFRGCSSLGMDLDLTGTGLTEIPASAFRDCTSLRNVKLPDTITSIGNDAFYGCSILRTINMPENLESIGTYAFSACNALEVINLARTRMSTVPAYAFVSCTGLKTMILPEAITSIGDYAFYDCQDLKIIRLPKDGDFPAEEGDETGAPAEDPAPAEGEEEDAEPALEFENKLSRFPDTLTSIGKYAFRNCRSLEAIILPDSITVIKEGTFKDCFKLAMLNFPSHLVDIEADAFNGCAKLTKFYTLDEMLITAEAYALQQAKEEAIEAINKEAKNGGPKTIAAAQAAIDAVNAATTPAAVEAAQETGIAKIKAAKKEEPTTIGSLLDNLGQEVPVELPDPVPFPATYTRLGDAAFRGFTGLKALNLPETITSIGASACEGCDSLETVVLPSSLTSTGIGAAAFRGCSFMSYLVFADGITITYIPESAFQGCSLLTKVVFPNTVGVIDKRAFQECTNLQTVVLPQNLGYIGDYAFWKCDNILIVVYPGSRSHWKELSTATINEDGTVTPSSIGGYNSALVNASNFQCADDEGYDASGTNPMKTFLDKIRAIIQTIRAKLRSILFGGIENWRHHNQHEREF